MNCADITSCHSILFLHHTGPLNSPLSSLSLSRETIDSFRTEMSPYRPSGAV